MSRNIDLSSKEWTDLIFEGKNKEFGAYQLRKDSEKRHTLAIIFTFVGLVIIALAFWAKSIYDEKKAEEARLLAEQARVEQEQFLDAQLEEVEEEEENKMDEPEPEPEIEEVKQEDLLNTQQYTEFIVKKDEEVKQEVKTIDDIKEVDTALGLKDETRGIDDANLAQEMKKEVQVSDDPKPVEKKEEPKEEKPKVEEKKVFESVEQMPQYPGGDGALQAYIASHIKYPETAAENGVQGRVTVRFVVKPDGSVSDVKVLRGKDPDLDKEAVRVVKTLPKFIPGKMNGQAVSVYFTLPINFKLQ